MAALSAAVNYARKALDDRIDYYGKSTIRAEVLKDRDTSRVGLFAHPKYLPVSPPLR